MGILFEAISVPEYIERVGREWVNTIGLALPMVIPSSRNPTANDVRGVLNTLEGYEIKYHVDEWSWMADITGSEYEYMNLYLFDFDGDEDQPKRISAKTSSDILFLEIVERLSLVCGPLVAYNDIDNAPFLITPNIDLYTARQHWRDMSDRIEALIAAKRRSAT
jgi:hypothetical protein